jgi:hypothetical protein
MLENGVNVDDAGIDECVRAKDGHVWDKDLKCTKA